MTVEQANSKRSTYAKRSAYALLLVVVLLTLMLLALTYSRVPNKANVVKAKDRMRSILQAIDAWSKVNDGRYPASLDEVSGYFPGHKLPADPFSNDEFSYTSTSTGFNLIFFGADGKAGGSETDSDIVYTEADIESARVEASSLQDD